MGSYVNAFLNQVRENIIPAEQQKQTQEVLIRTEWVKVAASIGVLACALLFSAPYLGASALLIPLAYICYEVATLANNYQKILETGLKAILSEKQFISRFTENAPVVRSIARLSGY